MTMRTKMAGVAAMVSAVLFAVGVAPAFAQGLATVEPTLDECRSFVETNGIPENRPVWENRGYSGWDVCLNMAYDGDLEGAFAAADSNGNGKLGAAEQRGYMDSVIGPVSDPDQSPLTLAKCASMVAEYGIPAERPFVDWSNRGYGDAEVCQSLAYDGTLDASFTAADANADGRLDRTEQSSYIAALTASPNDEVAPDTASPTSVAQDDSVVSGTGNAETGTEGVAQSQYGNAETGTAETGNAETGSVGVEETAAPSVAPSEPTISAVSEDAATEQPEEAPRTDETSEPETGVLSAVSDAVEKILPDTGGVSLLGILGGAVLIIGGFIAYRILR